MTCPSVSVLIVNWNTRELLADCLASLQTAEPEGQLEIVVVDNGSNDGSVEMVRERFDSVVVLANSENAGFAAAVNQADRASSTPFRLLLNSDTVVSAGVISGCRDHLMASPGVAAVGCRLLNVDGSHQSSVFRFPGLRGLFFNALYVSQLFPTHPTLNWDRYGFGDWQDIRSVDVVMGSFLLVRRDVVSPEEPLLDAGYFMYGEETDLCRRIVENGERVEFLPGLAITHVHGGSSKTPGQLAWAEEAKRRGQLRFLHRWRSGPVAWSANVILLAGLVPRWCVWAVLDGLDRVRGRGSTRRRRRAGVARFHLRAMVDLSVLDEPWGPPRSNGPSS